MYVQSATSHGAGTNSDIGLALGYPQKTIYHSLYESNKTFDVFFTDFPTAFDLRDLRSEPFVGHFHLMEEFEEHVKKGQLADYTFLEPRYYTLDEFSLANDQHPSHDVAEGEYLIQKLYGILRKGPNWNETAFLVTYDEHGGFYDHFPTPLSVPNPDNLVSENPPFNFTRIGVRVPAVIASPWLDQATIIKPKASPTPTSQYSHSSVAATIRALFLNTSTTPFLTKRDAWASTFEDLFTVRSEPRTDCPMTLPAPAHPMKHATRKAVEHKQEMNDLQRGFLKVVKAMTEDTLVDIEQLRTEREGGLYVMKQLEKYFKGQLKFTDLRRFGPSFSD
jgi:phospholipase C